MPIVSDNVWITAVDTTTTTTTTADNSFIKADVQFLAHELKTVYKVVQEVKLVNEIVGTKTGRFGPEKKLQKKKRAEDLPLGAHMPNIHSSELQTRENYLKHSGCRKAGVIVSMIADPNPHKSYDSFDRMPTKGKPFCVSCKRFLSKKSVSNLKCWEEEDNYFMRIIEPVVEFGVIVTYQTRKNSDVEQAEDCAAMPPMAENNEW